MGWLVEKAIGYNKIALLRSDGAMTILNEKSGDWVDGLWFSNDSYKKVKYYGARNAKPLVAGPVEIVPEVDLQFLGDECIKCDAKLDYWDCELCEDAESTVPVCFDCMTEHEEELIKLGQIGWDLDPRPLLPAKPDTVRDFDNLFDPNIYWE